MMRQAIVTKYLGLTNHRCARVKATAQVGSVTVAWDDDADTDDNHERAAAKLAHQFDWLASRVVGDKRLGYRLVGGALPDGTGNCYVLVEGEV